MLTPGRDAGPKRNLEELRGHAIPGPTGLEMLKRPATMGAACDLIASFLQHLTNQRFLHRLLRFPSPTGKKPTPWSPDDEDTAVVVPHDRVHSVPLDYGWVRRGRTELGHIPAHWIPVSMGAMSKTPEPTPDLLASGRWDPVDIHACVGLSFEELIDISNEVRMQIASPLSPVTFRPRRVLHAEDCRGYGLAK